MNLKDVIALVPEAQRPDAEKAVQEAIVAANPVAGIDSNEKAAAFIQGNKFFKGALDSEISLKIANHDEKFMAEKFPKLAKAEADKREQEVILRLKPETDPTKALEMKMEKQAADFAAILAERDKKETTAKQRELALKLAAAEGIPIDDIERFIADNDDATTAQVKAYAKRIKDFRDAAVDAVKKEKYGNNGIPKSGDPSKAMTQEAFSKLAPKEAAAFMASGGSISD